MSFFSKIKEKITGPAKNDDENLGKNINNNECIKENDSSEIPSKLPFINDSPVGNVILSDLSNKKELIAATFVPDIAEKFENLQEGVNIDDKLLITQNIDDLTVTENIFHIIDASPDTIIENTVEPINEIESVKFAKILTEPIIDKNIEPIKEEAIEKKVEKKSIFTKISSFTQKAADTAKSIFGDEKIKIGLTKTRNTFSNNLKKVLGAGRKIDAHLLDEIEELLITADIGVDTTEQIINKLRNRVKTENWTNSEDLFKLLREEISELLCKSSSAQNDRLYDLPANNKPYIILIIGVNGVGKTTTIGKLAYNYKNNGYNVIIGAADTFRAAANEQLDIWAERAGVDIVQQHQGADPAAVAFDTVKSAQSKGKDVAIIDTAGRLHNKKPLMDELEKITRVMRKLKDDSPDEVFLILDATTGQNAIFQAKEFSKVTPITGIVLTKLDGTAKGGVVIPIANELKIPVRYIGVGEQIDDLQLFSPEAFVAGLFNEDDVEKSVEE